MKALSVGKNNLPAGGFSTIELMLAFALISLMMGSVLLVHFSNTYWALAAQTSSEALYKVTTLENELRAQAAEDFYSATSSVVKKDTDPACLQGGLCYFLEHPVAEISSCTKFAHPTIFWRVDTYPTSSISLLSVLTNPHEALALGGDCNVLPPAGVWNAFTPSLAAPLASPPTALDVLSGVAYVATSQSPYLEIVSGSGSTPFQNGFVLPEPVNAIDVMRDPTTGSIYAYLAVASSTKQFIVVDITDAVNPTIVAQKKLLGVNSVDGQGWRVFYYGGKVYLTTRYLFGQPEFHIFDASDPANPVEVGSKTLNTSVYSFVVRDEQYLGVQKRVAYLATTHDAREVMLLDVTDSTNVQELTGAQTNLPGNQDALALFILGSTLYLGRESVTAGGPDLYALDAGDPFSASGGLRLQASIDIGTGRHLSAIRGSGSFLFVETANSTNSVGKVEIRDPLTLAETASPFQFTHVVEAGEDLDGDSLYFLSSSAPHVQAIKSQ